MGVGPKPATKLLGLLGRGFQCLPGISLWGGGCQRGPHGRTAGAGSPWAPLHPDTPVRSPPPCQPSPAEGGGEGGPALEPSTASGSGCTLSRRSSPSTAAGDPPAVGGGSLCQTNAASYKREEVGHQKWIEGPRVTPNAPFSVHPKMLENLLLKKWQKKLGRRGGQLGDAGEKGAGWGSAGWRPGPKWNTKPGGKAPNPAELGFSSTKKFKAKPTKKPPTHHFGHL